MDKTTKTLTKTVIENSLAGGWIAIKIIIVQNKISININRKAVIKGFIDSEIKNLTGPYMVGVNGTSAFFANINSNSLMPDAYSAKKKEKNKNISASESAASESVSRSAAESGSGDDDDDEPKNNLVIDEKIEILD